MQKKYIKAKHSLIPHNREEPFKLVEKGLSSTINPAWETFC